MNREPVLTKADMYRRIVAGEFGNTLPRWFDWHAWCDDPNGYARYKLWGVQHTTVPGFPGTRLDVDRDGVQALLTDGGFGGAQARTYCISPMVHQVGAVRWEGDICRSHDGPGLVMSGNFRPVSGSWRTHMKTPRLIQGTAAYWALKAVLNENSYDDLMILLDEYPDHVVELSALDVCFGTVPGRNAVVWEARKF